jgi:hypothetical protein
MDSSTTTAMQPSATREKNRKTWRPRINVTNLSLERPRHQPRETHLPGGPSRPTPTPLPLQCQLRPYPSMVSLVRHYSFTVSFRSPIGLKACFSWNPLNSFQGNRVNNPILCHCHHDEEMLLDIYTYQYQILDYRSFVLLLVITGITNVAICDHFIKTKF